MTPHSHIEYHVNGVKVDPTPYLFPVNPTLPDIVLKGASFCMRAPLIIMN